MLTNTSNNQIQSLIILLVSGVLLFSSCQFAATNRPENFYLGGIQVNEPDHLQWTKSLKVAGMNTISVTTYARHAAWNNDNLWWEMEEPAVVSEIEAAKAAGLNVVFIPRVLLDHYFEENDFLWHGMIMPDSEVKIQKWFESYRMYLTQWAKTCEALDVDVMAIGSELRVLTATLPVRRLPNLEAFYLNPNKKQEYIADRMNFKDDIPADDLWVRGADNYQYLEKYLYDEWAAYGAWAKTLTFADHDLQIQKINERRQLLLKEWTACISAIRKVYHGQLTYAANFDNYHDVAFWDQLDFIGINAYFPLRSYQSATDSVSNFTRIRNSWQNIFSDFHQFQKEQSISKPIIFTELGYIFKENCTVEPWQSYGFSIVPDNLKKKLLVWSQQKINLQERAQAIRALREVHHNDPQSPLSGILYWKLTTLSPHLIYEPFVLYLQGGDSMLKELQGFTNNQ